MPWPESATGMWVRTSAWNRPGVGFSQSANWVDGLGGARFTLPLAEKAAIIIAGDAGGGGATDYQVVGLFTYKFTPKLGLGLGWRYLDVNYGGSHQFLYDVAQTGALAGIFLELGGKPPVPVSASCSISPTEIWAGTPVAATISTQNFNPKHTISYKWSTSGGKIWVPARPEMSIPQDLRREATPSRVRPLRKRKEEQCRQLQCVIYRSAATAAGGELFGQSDHSPGGHAVHRHSKRVQSGSWRNHLQLRLPDFGGHD